MADDIGDLMFQAIERGDCNTVEQYFKTYSLNHCAAWDDGYALLNHSLEKDQREIAMFLLMKVSKVKKDSHMLSLHVAVDKKYKDIVQILLDKGADVNSLDKFNQTPIQISFKNKDMEMMKMLIDKGADVNARDYNNGETPLHISVRNKDMEMMQMLIDKGANVNALDDYGEAPLHNFVRIRSKDMKMMQMLVDKGADVNARDNNYGETPLHIAVGNKNMEMTQMLIEKGADVNAGDFYGATPLHISVENKDMKMMQMLIDKGVDVNAGNRNHETSLHISVKNKDMEMMQMLIDKGADVNARNRSQESPLHISVGNKHMEMVQLLLDKGAEVNIQGSCRETQLNSDFRKRQINFGVTPFHIAVQNKQMEMVRMLLVKGADVNARDKTDETTSLHFAVNNEKNLMEMVHMLLDKGAEVNARNKHGVTSLNLAVGNKQMESVRVLLNKGADVNARSDSGWTPLYVAILKQDMEMVKMLLDRGADVNTCHPGPDGDETPLLLAVGENASREVVQMLLGKGADINARNSRTLETTLHTSIKKRPMEIFQLLLDNGADVNSRSDVETPLLSAVRNGQTEMVEMLLNKGADVNTPDKNGIRAINEAVQFKSGKMVKNLLKHGAYGPYTKQIHGLTPYLISLSPEVVEHLLYHDLNNDENSELVASYYDDPNQIIKPVLMAKQLGYCLDKENDIMDYARRSLSLTIETECKEEVDHMKKQKIGDSNVTYYEFLRKRTHQLAVCLNNQFIMNTLEQGDYRPVYPMYADVINGHFIRGKFRKQLLDKVYEKCDVLFPTLPDDCRQTLLAYLNNEDLEVLITV